MRKFIGSHRIRTRGSMTTEYQDRFLPPYCHRTVVSTTTQKRRYHPLKGTNNDISTYRSIYVTHARIKHPPKPPQKPPPQPKALPQPTTPKVRQSCSSTPDDSAQNRLATKSGDYTSVYMKDFRAWGANKNQSQMMGDGQKIHRGLGLTNVSLEEGPAQNDPDQTDRNLKPAPRKKAWLPFENITSYRSDYVAHPLPPRSNRKPADQTDTGLPLVPARAFTKNEAEEADGELQDGAGGLWLHFHNWSLNTKCHSQGRGQVPAGAADDPFISTTHAHYTAHRFQRAKPILPPMNTTGSGKEPFQAATAMSEDYRAWEKPRHVPVRAKELEQKEKRLSARGPTPAQRCETNSKPTELRSERNKTSVRNATGKAQHPAGNQTFTGISGNEESRPYWSTILDRGGAGPVGDSRKVVSAIVSSRS